MRLHRLALFAPDGTCLTFAIDGFPNQHHIVVPAQQYKWGEPPVAAYHVPMDDDKEHWLRLYSEWMIYCDPATRDQGPGHAGYLSHSDGTPHTDPRYAHVRLGGLLTWHPDHTEPHPRVKAHMEMIRPMNDHAFYLHHYGAGHPVEASGLPGTQGG